MRDLEDSDQLTDNLSIDDEYVIMTILQSRIQQAVVKGILEWQTMNAPTIFVVSKDGPESNISIQRTEAKIPP